MKWNIFWLISFISVQFSRVQSLSCVLLFATPWTSASPASISSPRVCSNSFPLGWWSHATTSSSLLLLLPSIFPSIRVFANESTLLIRWPNYWSFNFSISSFNEYSGLISFRIDWFDHLAVQGTLKSLLQIHSLIHILQYSAFFMVQLSQPYTTMGKITALTIWYLSAKWCLCFLTHCLNLSVFLQRSKCLLISWLQSCMEWFWTTRKQSLSLFPFFPHAFAMMYWDRMLWSSFFGCWVLNQLLHSPLSPSSRSSLLPFCFLPLVWFHLHIWGFWYLFWFQQYVSQEIQDVQAGFWKGRGIKYQIANIHCITEQTRELQKTSISALLTTPKHLTVWITTNCGNFLKWWEYQTTLPVSWEICTHFKKPQLEPDME